ncbi:glutamate 5-kinase [Aureliella helgolandensis]|uniref:Glutamate 5-kinase n=1 Tax=Aureliella helgolandensis TaxID=2527968 RepID=A0A518G2J7_9BACT|nr:glutamate 5-kinase [Aureliella helgolandensis]QDV22814.1 Glutamate 5-kinase [Aureliella helgolandensis]
MEDNCRKSVLQAADTWVVKVGSRVLTGPDGMLDTEQVGRLAAQLSELANAGNRVVLVSSGAVAAGVGKLGLASRPTVLSQLQAVAAVGQAHLIQTYEQYFSSHGRHAAQILLVADDLDDRTRYLNVRNTLVALLRMGVIPVVNENDSVAVDELMTTFGDNDRLAAMVAGLFESPALVILSDVAGVYDRDPRLEGARVVSTIEQVNQDVMDMAVDKESQVSKGGMSSKLQAAQFVTQSGAPVVIAGGRTPNVLPRLWAGEELGTLFLPEARGLSPRKRWIGFSAQPMGQLLVDEGACEAILSGGPSLLAIGIVSVQEDFGIGDVVSICRLDGEEIARGLSNYSSVDLMKIRGQRSPEIEEILGHCPYEAVIHRDNMTVIVAADLRGG